MANVKLFMTLNDCLDHGTTEKSYQKEYTRTCNMKAVTLTIQKLWANVKIFCRQKDKQTGQKLYTLDLSMRGIKNSEIRVDYPCVMDDKNNGT